MILDAFNSNKSLTLRVRYTVSLDGTVGGVLTDQIVAVLFKSHGVTFLVMGG